MSKPFYVTTPIYYVNDRPHVGHAYTTVAVDMLTKFHRLAGREAFFLTGTDEHGDKIAEVARSAGLSEIEFCDKTVETFKKAWKNLEIEYDYFIRTTSDRHAQAVRKILDVLRSAKTAEGEDVIYSGFYEGMYCVGCEKFLTEKDLVDGLCPDHKTSPNNLKEKNYFFRLSAYLPLIREKIESGELCILPDERRREVLGLIKQDLPDFSLSREKVKWGIPLSFDESQVAYVWVDALSNYISAIGYADDSASFDKWWTGGEVVHLMAKDILKFHCLYWPAILMAAGLSLPETMYVHGFFTIDGEKMSKTLGNMIDPNEMVDEFGPDGARYLLLTQYPFGIDGDLQASRFVTQYNSDLANDLGNLVSRVVKMIGVNFGGKLPKPSDCVAGLAELKETARHVPDTAYEYVKEYKLTHAIAEGINLVKTTNKFFNDTAPWQLAKEGKQDELGGVLYACAEIIRIVSVVLFPIMPTKMREIRAILGLNDSTLTLDNAREFTVLRPGTEVSINESVFPRLKPKKKAEDAASTSSNADEGLIDISDFAKVKLRVAEILSAERVDGADKLLKLQILIGKQKRQIVAGIAQYYEPENLIGKKIVAVANLKPATIRGIESHGMLLAAKSGKSLFLIRPDGDLPAGAKIS